VHVFIKNSKASNYIKIGKTEMILNNLNPDFTTTFTLDFYFEKEQWIKFEVYDVDNNELEHIGDCETTIARIMNAPRQSFIADLHLPEKPT
jgi:C2 domain